MSPRGDLSDASAKTKSLLTENIICWKDLNPILAQLCPIL